MKLRDGDNGVAPGSNLGVLDGALARAREASSYPPLFTDPYAQTLIDAAEPLASHPVPAQIDDHVAARTKWFDDFFLAASSAGVSQVVILAPGLDTRAWRLPWLSDTVVYEVDRPQVLEFKSRVLAAAGARRSAQYVPVAFDMRDDWPKSLTAVGFDYTEPTAWAAEGLLDVLPANSLDHLLERIELYSARGSRIAVETRADSPTDVSGWLCARHWEISSTTAPDLMGRYHRASTAGHEGSVFVTGRKL